MAEQIYPYNEVEAQQVVAGSETITGSISAPTAFPNITNFALQGLPNNYKIQSGATTTAATSGTVTFNTAYITAPNVVAGAIGGAASEVAVNVISTTGFTYTASVAANISWIALGI